MPTPQYRSTKRSRGISASLFLSSVLGTLTAPSMCPRANSSGVRTSRTKAPSALSLATSLQRTWAVRPERRFWATKPA